MTLGRLAGDRVAGRFGPVAVVRYGSALAAVGLTTAALAGSVPLALAGWTLFGLGLSGGIPQLFSAAGHADRDHAGANVSRVAGLGYLGMLAGPAAIGPLTRVVPLNLAFFLPVALCVTAACAATVLRPGAAPAPPRRDAGRLVPGEAAEGAAPGTAPGAVRPATGSVPEPR
jgi:MFS family permease